MDLVPNFLVFFLENPAKIQSDSCYSKLAWPQREAVFRWRGGGEKREKKREKKEKEREKKRKKKEKKKRKKRKKKRKEEKKEEEKIGRKTRKGDNEAYYSYQK